MYVCLWHTWKTLWKSEAFPRHTSGKLFHCFSSLSLCLGVFHFRIVYVCWVCFWMMCVCMWSRLCRRWHRHQMKTTSLQIKKYSRIELSLLSQIDLLKALKNYQQIICKQELLAHFQQRDANSDSDSINKDKTKQQQFH